MNYYLKALKNYAVFSGRARRSELWYFVLFNIIFAIIAAILDNIVGTTFNMPMMNDGMSWQMSGPLAWHYGWIYLAYGLFILIPSLALEVRRLHDVGKSGWFLLIALIPIVGAIWLLVLFCTEGKAGDNEYGPNPKAGASEMSLSSESAA